MRRWRDDYKAVAEMKMFGGRDEGYNPRFLSY